MHSSFTGFNAWVMLGDFNASLSMEESFTGSSGASISIREFKECVDAIRMVDVNHSGFRFTWNQNPSSDSGILRKLDRVMANDSFIDKFVNAYVIFQAYRISDRCSAVLKIPIGVESKHKSFKFSNYVADDIEFEDTIKEGWNVQVEGHMMFKVVKRMRMLKKPIRKLMWKKGNLHQNVIDMRKNLDEAKKWLDDNPHDSDARHNESEVLRKFNQVVLEEECFLKQKAKVEWLRVDDNNSRYFHKVIRGRIHRTHCTGIQDPESLFTKQIGTDKAADIIRMVSDQEVKSAMFGIGESKSPGPDGYSSVFFKRAWNVIGEDVCIPIRDFFNNGRLLSELNHTLIILIPKSICQLSLEDVVNLNQSAFILGRRITENILLTQEIIKNYHRDKGVRRCAFKVDIQKAYDTVNWNFLKAARKGFGFPHVMIKWIIRCVSSTSFSININGESHGYFKGKRGLQEGDPMSPYLFTLVMEVLFLMMKKRVAHIGDFMFHPKCEQLEIINLCFVDNLFLFCQAYVNSVKVIKDALDEFKNCSGLTPSLPKSTAFFANVPSLLKAHILEVLPFDEGVLPFRYLGVPLVSSRLFYRDCKILVERVKKKVEDWKNKFLSFAGRVQLIIYVLTTMHVYWSSVFILPDAIIKDIKKILREFLWCQGEMKRGKAKVKWDDLCLPKDEGGLGIKRLKYWNIGLMATHVWRILNHKESLWVKWIHSYHLRNKSFWDAPIKPDSSWRFSAYDSVSDIMLDGQWKWHILWYQKYPSLLQIDVPQLLYSDDRIKWKRVDGSLHEFSVANALRLIGFELYGFQNAFLKAIPLTFINDRSNNWSGITNELANGSVSSASVVVSKLMFAATMYFIWQERNIMIFKGKMRSIYRLFEDIFSTVRLKLMSVRFKDSRQVKQRKIAWKLD
ncbi:uncharacterized protein [Rutidosis leptorrhynchoides]|uniref:uncharacterized protein n=1 Tax=Rutidosis leptorrhynchoides TaxID=125765 RepID=UPI003A9A3A7C